ncbi:hypothetical protein AVEN_265801-1 [Araneus ventricosus]|uniref:Integrase zinc-binding domain-containing protein n=1 Tax=Araneus ventricosus TaxID=182803 RepID=A0A4Y2RGL4_ARAVE|nr:hypothetical protein AVEN_265801-1 [Araneus ventricosus]
MGKGDVIATCEPVVDIFAHPHEFSEAQYLSPIFEHLEVLNEGRPRAEKKLNSSDRPSSQEIVPESLATKLYWVVLDSLQLKVDALYRRWESDGGSSCRWQLIIPKSRIQDVLRETHDSASGGHFGIKKTLSKTRERFYSDRIRAKTTLKRGVENAALADPEKDLNQGLKVACSTIMWAHHSKEWLWTS